MKIRLGEKEYDLQQSLPITLGDIKRLKTDFGMGLRELSDFDVEKITNVLLVLLQKQDAQVVMEQVNAIPFRRLMEITNFLRVAQELEDVENPTSGQSTL
jgi:hypothetical protein